MSSAFRLSHFSGSVLWVGLAAYVLHQVLHALVVLWHGDAAYFSCQWDCNWYVSIYDKGYATAPVADGGPIDGQANWAFFPLFPLVGGAVHWVTGVPELNAFILASKLLWLPAIWAFLTFQRAYLPDAPLWLGAALLTLNPTSIYANTGYTEPLFLMLACLSLTAIRRDAPVAAGAFGALLTATRAVGVGVGLAFLLYALAKVTRDKTANGGKLLFAGLMIPLGLAAYMVFLHQHTGDAMAFSHIQRAWDREMTNPITNLIAGFDRSRYDRIMTLLACSSFALAAYLAWRGEWGLCLFLIFATAVPLSTGYASMARYVMMQPAYVLAVVMLLHRFRWLVPVVLPVSALGYLWMSVAWQESEYFVI